MTVQVTFEEAQASSVVDHRYTLKREIARGAMGIVFEAEHTTLRAPVAIKTLTAGTLPRPDVHDRLMREARASALCRHPGIASALDAGTCALHGPYIAFEMIEGRSLESFLVARRRLDVGSVVNIAEQLCAAVGAAHRQEIVHRDIKPGNVLVSRGGGSDGNALRLVDFGVASVPGPLDVVDRKLTRQGVLIGTPEFISPEQLLDQQPATKLSDVYALGVLLFECLVGEVPFPGSPTAVMAGLLSGAIPSIRTVRPDVPVALERAIVSALAREPADRCPSAGALATACRQALAGPLPPLTLLDAPGRAAQDGAARRRFVRAPYAAPVRIVARVGPLDGRTEDISEGGVLVIAPSGCDEGEVIHVRFPLPSSGRIVAMQAVARWAKTHRGHRAFGLSFVSPPDDALADIRKYVGLMTVADAPTPSSAP
jgi:serine/threonine-protein kinase